MGLLLLFLFLVIIVGWLTRKSKDSLTFACIAAFVLLLVWAGCVSEVETTDMSTVVVKSESVDDLAHSDVKITDTKVSFVLEDGEVVHHPSTRVRILYDSEKPFVKTYDYIFKDFKAFLFSGIPYHSYEVHLCPKDL